MSNKVDPKKSSSAGGGAAPSKSSAPTASGGAPSSSSNTPPAESDKSNPETAAAAPGATENDLFIPPSMLDGEQRRIAEAVFAGAGPAQIHDYRQVGDHHVVILVVSTATAQAVPVPAAPIESPLNDETRKRAASFFEGINPDHIFGYTEYPDRHVIVVMDGKSTVKYTADK